MRDVGDLRFLGEGRPKLLVKVLGLLPLGFYTLSFEGWSIVFILFMVALGGGGFTLGLLAHEFIKDFRMWVIIVVTVIVLLLLMVYLTTNLKINGWLITAIAADLIILGGLGYVTREKQWV